MSVARRRRGSSKSEDTPLVTSEWGASNSDIDDEKENMGRDRTGEFQSALRSLQGRASVRQLQPGANGLNSSRVNKNLDQYAEFMRIARLVEA